MRRYARENNFIAVGEDFSFILMELVSDSAAGSPIKSRIRAESEGVRAISAGPRGLRPANQSLIRGESRLRRESLKFFVLGCIMLCQTCGHALMARASDRTAYWLFSFRLARLFTTSTQRNKHYFIIPCTDCYSRGWANRIMFFASS